MKQPGQPLLISGITAITVGCALLAVTLATAANHPDRENTLLIVSIVAELVGCVLIGLGLRQQKNKRS